MAPLNEDATARPFIIAVSVCGGRIARFAFDQDRVLVGRGLDCDLRIEHAAVARSQFLLERGVGSAGEPRWRITPFEATNPALVNDRPAVEGTLTPGDVIAVAEVRVVLESKIPKAPKPAGKDQITPMRAVLLAATVAMTLWVGYLLFGSSEESNAGDLLASAQTRVFIEPVEVHCVGSVECETRARDAYVRGKKFLSMAGADPGNYYRAAMEFDRASRYRDQSGRPLADMADVTAQLEQARARSESEFQDARFRLSRAIAAQDLKRQAEEAALLAQILPNDRHPYRIKLDAYRRTLPKPKKPGAQQVE